MLGLMKLSRDMMLRNYVHGEESDAGPYPLWSYLSDSPMQNLQ